MSTSSASKKTAWLGQFREILTASGTALVTYGLTDGNDWTPAIGVLMAAASLLWGVAFHRDPNNPGKLRWSLLRKLANAAGTALVTYGLTSPEKVESLVALLGVLGPAVASLTSWIDNDEGTVPTPPPGTGMILLGLLAIGMAMTQTSCGVRFTADGCILGAYEHAGHTFHGGPCVGPDIDQDGDADIDRYRVQWSNGKDRLRATYWVDGSHPTLVEYEVGNGIWIQWTAKSGVMLGPIPPPVEDALEGDPEPLPKPGPIVDIEAEIQPDA